METILAKITYYDPINQIYEFLFSQSRLDTPRSRRRMQVRVLKIFSLLTSKKKMGGLKKRGESRTKDGVKKREKIQDVIYLIGGIEDSAANLRPEKTTFFDV